MPGVFTCVRACLAVHVRAPLGRTRGKSVVVRLGNWRGGG